MATQGIYVPGEDDIGPSPAVERVVHGVVWALMGVSIVGIAFIFGLDPAHWFSFGNASATIRAVGVDFSFYGGLFFSRRFWTRKKWGKGFFWFVIALGAALLSWFANSLFVSEQHLVTQDLLNQAGFPWMTARLVNQIVGAIPIAIILLYAFVPRQQKADMRTPEQIRQDAQRQLALLEVKSQINARQAKLVGARVRGIVGGFVEQTFNLEEKHQKDAKDREEREKRQIIHKQLMGLARIHNIDPSLEDMDIEEQLTALGVWPVVEEPSDTPKVKEEGKEKANEKAALWNAQKALSGSIPTQFTASEIAEQVGRHVRTITRWMSDEYKGPYKIRCRPIKARGGARCASAKEVARIMAIINSLNPPADTAEETSRPALEQMPVLVVSQVEGHANGHSNGHTLGQTKGQGAGQGDRQEEELE